MYNLLMDRRSGCWEAGGATVSLGRYLEYTDDAIAARLSEMTPEVIEQLQGWPALFAYEFSEYDDHNSVVAWVGRITSIQIRGSSARIGCEFDPSVPPLTLRKMLAMLWELDIEYETDRTHWAVKDIDLEAVLRSKGIIGTLPAPVSTPQLAITSETVERALSEVEHLVKTGRGAASALDRIHTALHGYLIQLCVDASLLPVQDEQLSLTAAFKKLREDHPKFSYAGPRPGEVTSALKASSSIIEVLNTLRNNASMAHPNSAIVPEPEAMYLINLARSLLHYVEMKRTTN
ncbi:abortive infection family protein [Duganella sacchari]|jgi:hypothetical protein|nr:abortive infection family protein [Duganella sacchari]